MTNSNENCTCPSGDGSLRHPCPIHPPVGELKVGDIVSLCDSSGRWHVDKITKIASDLISGYPLFVTQFSARLIKFDNLDWQRGIHPSLIPDGFSLVETCLLETSRESLDGYIRERARLVEELEVAQKEIERLKRMWSCQTCKAYGQIGGQLSDGSWETIDCPDCNAAPKPEEG